ncbi:MAG: RIP metalloprotease RseP [Helicobacteraceae bacterium]|nr:RIP metalloprotease RseP [Helicobacteraceae bacterium]
MWIIVSIIVLSFLIFFHESGHFLVARFFGVKVEVFSVGFGKKIWTKTYNGTEYAISAIPLGGYVKMKGQDDLNPNEISNDDDSYNTKAPWKKICILFAGSGANILLAFILYIFIGFYGITTILPTIGKTIDNSPAYKAGLMQGDTILKINGNEIKTWRDLSQNISNQTQEINIEYKRGNKTFQTTITPEMKDSKNIFGEDVKQGFIGIVAKGDIARVRYGMSEIIPYAIDETIFAAKLIVLSLQKIIIGILPINQLGGPIAIVQAIAQAQEAGFIALLGLSALISINLGILNLLPIPALDGGHIVFTLYEWLTKRPLNENIAYKLTIFGWIVLFGLMILGLYNDIGRIAVSNG